MIVESLSGTMVSLKTQEEKKSSTDGIDTYVEKRYVIDVAPSLMLALSSVFSGNKTYRFRLMRTATLVTSGAGTMNLATALYPSQFDQYSALSSLFNQARLRSTRITYTGMVAPGVTTVAQGTFCSALDPSYSTAVAPSYTYTLANRLPKSKNFSLIMSKWPVSNSYKFHGRPWSIISSVSTGSDPVGGLEGAWVHCISSTVAASATYLNYVILADYEFRNVH